MAAESWESQKVRIRFAHFIPGDCPLDAACSDNPESGPALAYVSSQSPRAIAAMDFFSVPTVTFNVLYVFFIVGHDRRRILHFNVSRHPTSLWIVQQLPEAFPFEPSAKFLILDHDAKYGTEVPAAIRSMDITAVRTAVGCPWQNGVAERWVGSCRRELLDHVIASTSRI